MRFWLRTAFWLGLAFVVMQPHGLVLTESANRMSAVAMETGRSIARDGLDQIACTSLECTGAKLMATTTLASADTPANRFANAPYPAPPLNRHRT